MKKLNLIQDKERVALFLILLIAIAIRLYKNFSTEYIGGNNGAYYLILIRNLLEKGELRYLDFPLIFWLEASIAFLISKLGIANVNSAIDLSSRLFDSIVPALSIFPAYSLVKKILNRREKWFVPILLSAVSILYFSFLVLVSDFQKNSLGLLWLFSLIYFLYRIHEEPSRRNYLLTLLFFVLTGLTHYGCIAVALVLVVVDIFVKYTLSKSWVQILKAAVIIVMIIMGSAGLVYLVSVWRFKTFIQIPFEIFREPIITFLLTRKPVLSPFDLANIVLINTVAVTSFYLFIKNFKAIGEKYRSFILTMIILSLFLSSPFLGLYAAQRLYFISFLVALPLLPFIYNYLRTDKIKKAVLYSTFFVLLMSTLLITAKGQQANMNNTLYAELLKIRNSIPKHNRTLIVARHGMEFWTKWILRIDSIREDELTGDYWKWYTDIYFLHQKKMKSDFGPSGMFGQPFREPVLPENAHIVFESEYFDLYRATNPPKDFSIFKQKR